MTVEASWPEVLICIPTYNRCDSLARSIESALSQDYPAIRIVVLDNCSTDATESVVQFFSSQYSTISYLGNSSNVGASANFNRALKLSSSAYMMWLADDDWISQNYVSSCMQVLLQDPSIALVSGQSVFVDGSKIFLGQKLNLTSRFAWLRLLKYYFFVNDNSVFYGVYRNNAAKKVPLADRCGSDWHFIACIAYQGVVVTTPASYFYRLCSGASSDMSLTAKRWGEPWWVRMEPYLGVAFGASRNLIVNVEVYGRTSYLLRFFFAVCVFAWLVSKKVLARRIYCSIIFFLKKLGVNK